MTSLQCKMRHQCLDHLDVQQLLQRIREEALLKEKEIGAIAKDYSTTRYLEGMAAGLHQSALLIEGLLTSSQKEERRGYD